MNKFFIFLFLFLSLILFNSCGDNNTQGGGNIACKSNADCKGGICSPAGICKVFICSPSEDKCLEDGKTKHICKADGSGFEDIKCDFKCKDAECIDKIVCTPYSKMCTGSTEYIECSDDGMNWTKTECDGETLCLEGECKTPICTPNEKSCVDSFHVKACNANGTAELNYKCPNDEKCLDGSCVKINCNPSETKCSSDGKLLTCSSDGSSWDDGIDCGASKSCNNGECKDIICNEGQITCSSESNRYYKECNESLTGWEAPVLCGENKVCENNLCVDKLCSPGEKKCDENGKVITCNDDSLSWSEAISCSNGEVCKRGNCVVNGVCTANEKRCLDGSNAYFEVCDEWGTGWLNPISCGAGNICSDGECQSAICVPNEIKCVATDTSMTKYQVCNSNGTAYLDVQTCENGNICLGNECRTITCTPGENICDNNKIMECKSDGSGWQELLACGDSKSCVNGDCEDKICTPSAERCVENVDGFIETCNASGTAWENKHHCGTQKTCLNDACVTLQCSPGQTQCSADSQNEYLTCNDSGTAFENLTACPNNQFCMTGLCMECFPGSKECIDNNSFKVCNDNGIWEGATACAGGDSCENGSCAVKICEPNEVQCLDNNAQYFKTCNSLGTAWLNPVSCGAGNTCVNAECKPILCVHDSTECYDGSHYIKCNETGTSYSNPTSCEDGEECLGGSCRTTTCTPGKKECDENNNIKECNELGEWSDELSSCGTKICESGTCIDRICNPTDYRCGTNNREQCNSNGTEWLNAPCGAGKICNGGVCENIICNSGDKICSGNKKSYKTCNVNGTAYDVTTNCANNEYCNNGACVTQVCTPNERVCDANTNSVKICNELGSNYSNPQACTDGTICNNGICEATICNSGETRCDGSLIQTCSSNGTTWQTGVACPNGQTCSGNQCIDYVCAVGEKQCVNNSLYKECNTTRTGFGDPIACGTNKICTGAGTCVNRECAPGQTKCVTTDATHKSYQVCNATGSGWEVAVDCIGSLICDVDTNTCKSVICNAGDMRCLDDNGTPQSQTCNASGSGWNDPVTCTGANPICTETGCDNVICDAYEEIQCTGNTPTEYRRCNLNGTGWIASTENCADDYICKNNGNTDECKPVICTPNSKVCSSDTGYRVCNSDGTELAPETTCEDSPASGQPKTCYAGECRTECDMASINKSYMGCEYYAIDLQNWNGEFRNTENTPFYYSIIISNPSSSSVNVTITDELGYNDSRNISPNSIEVFSMDTLTANGYDGSYFYEWTDNHQILNTNRGTEYSYNITSNLPIVAYQFSPLGGAHNYSNDASILIPVTAYGTEYRALSWPSESNGSTVKESITIVANEDNTTLNFTPKADIEAGGGINAIAADTTYTTTLSRGEVIQFVASNNNLNASYILADKPIGVFGGHFGAYIPSGIAYADHIEQQLFPTNTWGNNYIIVKTEPRLNETDYYRIVTNEDTVLAFEPNTISCVPVGTNCGTNNNINAGCECIFNNDIDFKITSNKPIMMGQFLAGSEETGLPNPSDKGGDPAFILQVPVEQFRSDYLFLVPSTYGYNFVTIVAPTTATVTLDGSVVADGDFTSIGSTGYMRARVSLNGGSHSVVATKPIGISVYGYESDVSYGYPGGLNLKAVK